MAAIEQINFEQTTVPIPAEKKKKIKVKLKDIQQAWERVDAKRPVGPEEKSQPRTSVHVLFRSLDQNGKEVYWLYAYDEEDRGGKIGKHNGIAMIFESDEKAAAWQKKFAERLVEIPDFAKQFGNMNPRCVKMC